MSCLNIIRKVFLALLFSIISFVACSKAESNPPIQGAEPTTQEKSQGVENSPVESYRQPVGELTNNTISVNGANRTYLTYMPQSAVDNIPVIIQFHGGTETAQDAYYTGGLYSTAEIEGILMVYPQAETSTGSVWNTLHSEEGNKVSADDFGFVEAIINRLAQDSRIDTSRIYVVGYSNGAAMAYQIACHLNYLVAGFVVHSGNFPLEDNYPCNITHETPGLIFNGTSDTIRPLEGIPTYAISVRDGAEWWSTQNNSIGVRTTQEEGIERTIYTSASGMEVQLFIIEGGGHEWFNFPVDGMPMNIFIWDFLTNSYR